MKPAHTARTIHNTEYTKQLSTVITVFMKQSSNNSYSYSTSLLGTTLNKKQLQYQCSRTPQPSVGLVLS